MAQYVCENCRVAVQAPPTIAKKRRFCSRACSEAWRGNNEASRFWSHTEQDGACLLWTGHVNCHGYGAFSPFRRRNVLAHRYAFALHGGTIPAGGIIMHTCDNRRCVNPKHLRLGTDAENCADRDHKGRQAALRGDTHGMAKLTAADVRWIRAHYTPRTKHGMAALARRFGVTPATIRNIVVRASWKHIE